MAKARLEELTVDNSKDEAKFRQDLLNIAKTTLRWGTMVLGCCGHAELLEPYPNAVAREFSTALWQAAGVGPSAAPFAHGDMHASVSAADPSFARCVVEGCPLPLLSEF